MDSPAPVPPPVSNSNERTWCMLAHLSALSGFIIPFGGIIGPIVIWQIKKEEIPAVVAHGKAVLNFQISCLIYFLVCLLLTFVVIGLPLMFVLGIGNLVCIVMAAIKANNGEFWKYPASIQFIK